MSFKKLLAVAAVTSSVIAGAAFATAPAYAADGYAGHDFKITNKSGVDLQLTSWTTKNDDDCTAGDGVGNQPTVGNWLRAGSKPYTINLGYKCDGHLSSDRSYYMVFEGKSPQGDPVTYRLGMSPGALYSSSWCKAYDKDGQPSSSYSCTPKLAQGPDAREIELLAPNA
ncbi:hypothetical protein AB0N09_43155 [Streptomyces erythrochromogenes]|uniref:hypothetical protein n=1 Tax=Streptomyces erythrochromogenes TaxID=285574 RepID=UPI0034289B69